MMTHINFRLYYCHLNRNLPNLRRELSTVQLKKHYDILNVNSKSTVKEIKESFLRLSKVYHPDNKLTGSHNKFVELKEAYDTLKDGPSRTTSDTNRAAHSASSNSYSNYQDYQDLRYDGSSYHRTKSNYSHQFGGPYYNSKSPWEDYKRDSRASQRVNSSRYGYHKPSGPVSFTLTLSAIAWIIIFSCASLLMDIGAHKRREKNQEYSERYLDRIEEVKKIEEALRRRAMLKRAQQSQARQEKLSTTTTHNDNGSRVEHETPIIDLSETPAFAVSN